MTEENDNLRIMLKIEMKLALDEFKKSYKKISKGIEKIYTDAMLSNDLKEVQKQHSKFFQHISQSKFYKEKWKE